MIFVNSMGDLFHDLVPDLYVRRVFEVMLTESQHVYQVLTKRPSRMLRFLRRNADLVGESGIPRHIWLGTSIEQQSVAYRAKHLRKVPATVRFLSCEPLIGALDLDLEGIHWVIAGGESGPTHRAMNLQWARDIRETCVRRGVPFFFKQVGGRTPKAGGCLLDGRIWHEFPEPRPLATV